MKKSYLGMLMLICGLLSFFSFRDKPSGNEVNEKGYEILKKWEMPEDLEEISGIAWIGDRRVACIQDEDGIIFIYNLETSKVDNAVAFGDDGDYEGIAVIEEDAYVLRSDGVIFEVKGFRGGDPRVSRYVTELSELPGIDLESLSADPANNRLLIAVKHRSDLPEQKEIFVFDLSTKKIATDPLFVVDLNGQIFREVDEKPEEKFIPGDMGIHPGTGEYYILDGTRAKLLITERDGTPKKLFMLNSRDFGNPEGLTFSPNGDLYISNEAENGPANILQVILDRSVE